MSTFISAISVDIGRVVSALALFWTYCLNAFPYWTLRFSKIWSQNNSFFFSICFVFIKTLLIQMSN